LGWKRRLGEYLIGWMLIPGSLSFLSASLAKLTVERRLAWSVASALAAPIAFAVLLIVPGRGDTS